MKSRETALNLKRFEVDEKGRKVADLEHMIREFETMATDLDRQIQAEEDRSGIKDPSHFAYSTFAKSASQRRDNLRASANEFKLKLEVAQREHADAAEQLKVAGTAEPREKDRVRRRHDRPAGVAFR